MSQTSYLEKYGTVAGAPRQEGRAPIVRFVTDDHKVIGVMFGHITRTFEDRVSQYLMVSSPAGVIVIRGPGVSDYHEKLAQGIADLVQANGKESPRCCIIRRRMGSRRRSWIRRRSERVREFCSAIFRGAPVHRMEARLKRKC